MSRNEALGRTRWQRRGKKRVRTLISKGLVDFDKVQSELNKKDIYLRGGGADEAPEVYKNLEEVLEYQGDTIKVKHRLHPIGVAMAGEDIRSEERRVGK